MKKKTLIKIPLSKRIKSESKNILLQWIGEDRQDRIALGVAYSANIIGVALIYWGII